MSHTPGPWTAEKVDSIDGDKLTSPLHLIWTEQTLLIARTCFAPNSKVNADLITAAPDLLTALTVLYEETADYIRLNHLGDVHHNHSMQLARDAIAKAEGK